MPWPLHPSLILSIKTAGWAGSHAGSRGASPGEKDGAPAAKNRQNDQPFPIDKPFSPGYTEHIGEPSPESILPKAVTGTNRTAIPPREGAAPVKGPCGRGLEATPQHPGEEPGRLARVKGTQVAAVLPQFGWYHGNGSLRPMLGRGLFCFPSPRAWGSQQAHHAKKRKGRIKP